jgi:hypothetical protein
MQYNLTEEQSTKFYNDLKDAVDIINRVQQSAVTAFLGWYDDYVNNHHSIFGFKPMSIEKFGKKITLTKGIVVNIESSNRKTISNKDGWSANLRPKTIAKLTKNSYLDILGEVNMVSAACMASMCAYREYEVWTDMIHKMENYMQVPYTIDQEWLDELEGLSTKLYYYSYILGDKK